MSRQSDEALRPRNGSELTPLVLSKSLQLSPLAVILSVLFWGWLWGIAGGLMAALPLAIRQDLLR